MAITNQQLLDEIFNLKVDIANLHTRFDKFEELFALLEKAEEMIGPLMEKVSPMLSMFGLPTALALENMDMDIKVVGATAIDSPATNNSD